MYFIQPNPTINSAYISREHVQPAIWWLNTLKRNGAPFWMIARAEAQVQSEEQLLAKYELRESK